MADQWLIEAVKQAPALGVLVWIVFAFLKNLKDLQDSHDKIEAEKTSAIRNLGELCHSFQRDIGAKYDANLLRMSSALDRNTEALGRNTEAINQFEVLINNIRDKQ